MNIEKNMRNYETDLSYIETFGKEDADNGFTPITIPDDIDFEIECWASEGNGVKFKASRIGGRCDHCKMLDKSRIEITIPLSRWFLGAGYLCRKLRVRFPGQGWNGETAEICIPRKTGHYLWDGPSDSYSVATELQDTFAVAFKGKPGISAYELAVKHGFKGTLEEWFESLRGEVGDSLLSDSGCSLDKRVDALENMLISVLSGSVLVPNIQVKKLGVWDENNLIVTGAGAPTQIPDRAGQFYIDVTARTLYYSTGNAAVADWKNA